MSVPNLSRQAPGCESVSLGPVSQSVCGVAPLAARRLRADSEATAHEHMCLAFGEAAHYAVRTLGSSMPGAEVFAVPAMPVQPVEPAQADSTGSGRLKAPWPGPAWCRRR